MIILRTVN